MLLSLPAKPKNGRSSDRKKVSSRNHHETNNGGGNEFVELVHLKPLTLCEGTAIKTSTLTHGYGMQ
jgi:hypothetical protein